MRQTRLTQLARMKAEGTTILWSPRSNLDLYAATTKADIAMRMGSQWRWVRTGPGLVPSTAARAPLCQGIFALTKQ